MSTYPAQDQCSETATHFPGRGQEIHSPVPLASILVPNLDMIDGFVERKGSKGAEFENGSSSLGQGGKNASSHEMSRRSTLDPRILSRLIETPTAREINDPARETLDQHSDY